MAAPSQRQVRTPVQFAAGRAFFQQGARWVDSHYDGKAKPKQIKAFSEKYFKLLAEKPELRRIFSVGQQVVFVVDGEVYEIIEENTSG